MNSNIYQITEQILLKEKEFCSQDNKLLKNKKAPWKKWDDLR